MEQMLSPYQVTRGAKSELGNGVPAHWSTLPVKRLAALGSGLSIDSGLIEPDGRYPVFGGNGVRGYTERFTHEGVYPLVGRQGALCGNINYASGRFWASEHAVVAEPKKGVDPKWLGELLRAMNLGQYSVAAAQPGLAVEKITRLIVPVPPTDEQRAIARFLDHETARIDELIAKQQRLIELLKEKRQAVISHAVTKGLNPAAPMKDSGVEWLGKVPAHWNVRKLKSLVPDGRQIMYGIVLPGPNVDDGVPIVKGGDVKPERLRVEKLCRTAHEIEAKYERSRLLAGDIVYAIRGGIGDVAIVPPKVEGANITQDAARVSPKPEFSSEWLLFALQNCRVFAQLEQKATGATIRGINIFDLKRACIPVPPGAERKEITEYLLAVLGKLDSLRHQATEAEKLLRERRTALISAAVTGKIDVRDWQPPEANAA